MTHRESEDQLSLPDTLRLIKTFASLGITKVRFTGGEPLLRREIVDLVHQTSLLSGISMIGLTTNGLLLEPKLPSLINAGLNRLNISLDTLDRTVFRKVTGVNGFDRVYSAITTAEQSGAFDCIKINTVVMRNINDHEIHRFALWALERKIDLRLIEFMPTRGSGWGQDLFVSEDEIRNQIGLMLEPLPVNNNSPGPARTYTLPGAPGRISFISAISRNFCHKCNRLRLTSDGVLLGCLFLNKGIDLKPVLAGNRGNHEIARVIRHILTAPGLRRMPEETSILRANPFMRMVGG